MINEQPESVSPHGPRDGQRGLSPRGLTPPPSQAPLPAAGSFSLGDMLETYAPMFVQSLVNIAVRAWFWFA